MNTELERMCDVIDEVLAAHDLPGRVAGGYVARNGLLFSLTDTTFLPTAVCRVLQQTLGVREVVATVGVILVQGWSERVETIEGNFENVGEGGKAVETVDVMELMAAHQAAVETGRLPAAFSTSVSGL